MIQSRDTRRVMCRLWQGTCESTSLRVPYKHLCCGSISHHLPHFPTQGNPQPFSASLLPPPPPSPLRPSLLFQVAMSETDAPAPGAFSLADELWSLSTSSEETSYVIPGEVAVPDLSERDRANVLNAVVDCIASAASSGSDGLEESVSSPDGDSSVFDALRSFLLHFPYLSSAPPLQAKLLDALTTGFASALDDTARDEANAADYRAHRTTLEKWGLLLQWFVLVAERERARTAGLNPVTSGRKKGVRQVSNEQFNWPAHLPTFLSLLSRAMRTLQSARIWATTLDRDAFISGCFLRPVFLLIEEDTYTRAATPTEAADGPARQNPIKAGITKVVGLAVKHQSQIPSMVTLMMQAMQYTEHLPDYLAEMTHIVRTDFGQPRLADELLREVSNKTFGSADAKSSKSFGRFLVRFAELSPASVRKAMAMLHKHLDSEVRYTILPLLPITRFLTKANAPSSFPLYVCVYVRVL